MIINDLQSCYSLQQNYRGLKRVCKLLILGLDKADKADDAGKSDRKGDIK